MATRNPTGEMVKLKVQISAICFLFVVVGLASGQVLTPPYFNLAVGRPIEATATCGVGVSEPELFCKLTGANPDKKGANRDFEVIDGHMCDRCNISDPNKTHSPEFAADETERWWQSPPLSRGLQFNEVNLTIHLEQEFHVSYVYIKMGNSPRPGVFALEHSKDNGSTWQPWQFFAVTPNDCELFFRHQGYSDSIDKDDSVICSTEYSKVVPLENGEIDVSLLNNRPGSKNFSHSLSLQNFVKATDIRIRLLRTNNLLGNLMGLDSTLTRRYYYSIKDISIGGVCVCNDHAKDCDRIIGPGNMVKLVCICQNNTCGQRCETCCPGYMQKPWRPGNACELCQCHGHSTECRYDPEVDRNRSSVDIHGRYDGGGVCINCRDNTVGINCEKCKPGYFRPSNTPITSIHACRRCRCDLTYSTGNCLEGTGQCLCKPEYTGYSCDRCSDGYHGYPRCIPCQCHKIGTQEGACDAGGRQCPCKPNFSGLSCDECAVDYYDFPECRSCSCDIIGSHARGCDLNGKCHCRINFSGRKCGRCAVGYYNHPTCDLCDCELSGCTKDVCDKDNGHCICKENFSGPRCERCAEGHYNWPQCIQCRCDFPYSTGNCTDGAGECLCKPGYDGANCERCIDGYFGYPRCIPCQCYINGTQDGVCDAGGRQCPCKLNFNGPTCSECAFDYYNFPECRSCDCDIIGSLARGCDLTSGKCHCRTNYGERKCSACAVGYYNHPACDSCDCEHNGTTAEVCDKDYGRCICKENFSGTRCERCAKGFFNWPQCIHCDSCVGLLLDDIEIIDHSITTMRRELDIVSVSISALQRLETINRTVDELRPLVDNLTNQLTGPSQLNLTRRELSEVQTLAAAVNTKSNRTVRRSKSVRSNAATAKRRAETLYEDLIRMAIKEANDAVDFAKQILETMQNGSGGNIEKLLMQAEEMLTEIKLRNFSFSEGAAEEELGKARDTLKQAMDLMDRAAVQFNRTTEMSSLAIFNEIRNKLRDIQNSSRHSINSSQSATELNNRIRQLVKLVTDFNYKIRQTQTEIRSCVEGARKLLRDAGIFMKNARKAHAGAERKSSQLDGAIEAMQHSVVGLSEENRILRPLVRIAREHALQLKADADLLDGLMVDTRAIGEAALNASSAYQTITEAIGGALNASLVAIRVAEEASNMYLGVADNATKFRNQSELLKKEADDITTATSGLKKRLDNVTEAIDELKKINILIIDERVKIANGLDELPADGYETKAREAATKATAAKIKAEDADKKIKDIVDGLSEDQRKISEIKTDVDHVNLTVTAAEIEVEQVRSLIPNVTDILSRLNSRITKIRQLGLDLKTSIMLLRNSVSVARDEANLIGPRVAMTFTESSSLQIRSPRSLMSIGFYSRVSLYFKTNANDGLLFYAGPTQNPGTQNPEKTWDYMSLEVVDGKAVFRFDLGSGAANITTDKTVSDGVWYQAIMSRSERNGTLEIRTPEGDNFTAEGRSDGESLVLNFDESTSVFIGGITKTKKDDLKDILRSINFTGCVQDVSFDGAAIGLWNFISAEDVNGCNSRDSGETPVNGYMFGGNGYVILARDRFNPAKNSLVKFSFRTFASEGLMFLMGMPGKDFLSLELNDGKVIYRYDLGSEQATIITTNRYNDGKWHKVASSCSPQIGMLTIDLTRLNSTRSPYHCRSLNITNNDTYFGGFKGEHTYSNASVTQKGFEGCIKDIELESKGRQIAEHIEAKDILPGCPETIVRVVSFTSDVNNSYISVDPVNIDETFEMSMKFRTIEGDGLLSYVTDNMETQSSAFSLSLKDGRVVAINTVEGRMSSLQSRDSSYNDGRWHYLTVRKDGGVMSLHLDDSDSTTTKVEGKRRTITSSPLFFGGFPSTHTIIVDKVASSTSFVGSIGDVIIGHGFINFANVHPDKMFGVVLSDIHIPDPTSNITAFTVVIPTYSTSAAPVAMTVVPSADSCLLPVEPLEETETGFRFGSRPDSRQEYDNFPNVSSNRANNYSVQFKTTTRQGVLFYVANKRHSNFVGIYVNDGRVSAAFDCGGGLARASSANTYNDGQWHTLVFERNQTEGTLTIDEGTETVSATAPGTSRSLKVIAPYYVGGLPSDFDSKGASNIEGISSGFVGCLRNFLYDGKAISNPDRVVPVALDNCSSPVEVGTFFHTDAGHIILSDNFTVGLDFNMSLGIKPRTLSGVLLSVHNPGRRGIGGDYLVLQMVNGEVVFNMDNGGGDVSTKYVPPAKNQLCDGQWHSIRAQKAKNVLLLTTDEIASHGIGAEGVSDTNTEDPLYVGGVPEVHRGIKTHDQFVGCIRQLQLNNVLQDFTQARAVGRINLNSCPTT